MCYWKSSLHYSICSLQVHSSPWTSSGAPTEFPESLKTLLTSESTQDHKFTTLRCVGDFSRNVLHCIVLKALIKMLYFLRFPLARPDEVPAARNVHWAWWQRLLPGATYDKLQSLLAQPPSRFDWVNLVILLNDYNSLVLSSFASVFA